MSIIPAFYPYIVPELGNRRICDGEGAPALGKQRCRDILGKLSPGFPCLCPQGASWSWVPRTSVTESSDHRRRRLGWGGLAARVEAGAVGVEQGWVLGSRQHDKLPQPEREGLWPNSKGFAQVGLWVGAVGGERTSWMNHLCPHLLYLLPGMV